MRIACLVTGIPRTFERCSKTLKRYFQNHDVDYYLVYRDENCDKPTRRRLEQVYKPVDVYVTNRNETAEFEKICPEKMPSSCIWMWHECLMGSKIIEPNKHRYDCFVRTRFDSYFAAQFFRDDIGDVGIIPDHYNWTGLNDMYFAGKWDCFKKYCNTYNLFPSIEFQNQEVLVKMSFNRQDIKYRQEKIPLALLRPYFEHLSDQAFEVLIHDAPESIIMKFEHYAESRVEADKEIRELTDYAEREAAFPVGPERSLTFYLPETSTLDGSVCRFFRRQAYMNIPIPNNAIEFEFTASHWISHWPLEKMDISIDGHYIHYAIDYLDNGTALIKGRIPFEVRGRAPWSKFAITYDYTITPSIEYEGSNDHRVLSLAIGPIRFIEYPK